MYLNSGNLIVDETHNEIYGTYDNADSLRNYGCWVEQTDTTIHINEAFLSISLSDGRTGLLRIEGPDDVSITSRAGEKHTIELRCDGFTLTLIDDNQLTEADFEGVDKLL